MNSVIEESFSIFISSAGDICKEHQSESDELNKEPWIMMSEIERELIVSYLRVSKTNSKTSKEPDYLFFSITPSPPTISDSVLRTF